MKVMKVSEKGQGQLLLIIILAIMGIGLFAGVAGLIGYIKGENVNARPSYSEYVPDNPGDCFVPPQGDPLGDEHWADINQKNCSALKDQSTAHYTDAETRSLNTETDKGIFGYFAGLGVFGFVALALAGIVIIIIIKK